MTTQPWNSWNITRWAAIGLVALSNVQDGGAKLLAQPWMVQEFTQIMHLPLWMMYFIGVAQVATGALLLPSKTRRQATFANMLLCSWAMASVLMSGMGLYALVPLLSFLLSLWIYVYDSINIKQRNA